MTPESKAAQIREFYELHPYPPAVDDIDAYRRRWDRERRTIESHFFWPSQPYREDRSILVAGCGTAQAARYAVRWPKARVVGIDVSETSLAFEHALKEKHGLANLELHRLPIERAGELGEAFDFVACTGVLHHLTDPDAGLRALRGVLAANGAINLMVYAPYGRAGVYLIADYCRRLGIEPTPAQIDDLVATLRALPPDHPLVPLLRSSPDFADRAGVADALLHPNDRAYSVPQFLRFLHDAGLFFGRWLRQAPYLPACGAIAATPHATALAGLPIDEQYAALELFRGTMVRHSAVAYASPEARRAATPDFDDGRSLQYRPIRMPETTIVRERVPPGAAAVLINRSHTYTDLYLPVDAAQLALYEALDGRRTIADLCGNGIEPDAAREFVARLWRWDQIVSDSSGTL